MTKPYHDEPYEPLEQRKAKAIREKRVVQLYTHIYQSLCAAVAINVRWHNGELEDDSYKDEMTNQLRSIVYNIVELTIDKRPNKLG